MPIFKYTVANKEGKKLSGTVEAPSEKIARIELNNLGFSILLLQETETLPPLDESFKKFVFEATDKNSKLISGTIPSKDKDEAYQKLTKEYDLLVTAIWDENSTEEEIEEAKKIGAKNLQDTIAIGIETEQSNQTTNLDQEKKEQFTKTKIDMMLKNVNELLKKFNEEFDISQKVEINKKINKLLRIKNSKNIEYIFAVAEDLLKYLESQEKLLKEKGFQDKRVELEIETKKLLENLNKSSKPESIGEDIIRKIDNWESAHLKNKQELKTSTKLISKILSKIKNFFTTPPQLFAIKNQIKVYNKQLWDFIWLYFKEPTPEYKEKVKNSIKTIWNARKKAVHSLAQAKKLLRERKKEGQLDEHIFISFIEELNALTGWLLAFYIIYYFAAIYLTTKNFGLPIIPKGFIIYESKIFKYTLTILFILHSTTTLKINFFKKNLIANFVLPPVFIFGSIVVLLNF